MALLEATGVEVRFGGVSALRGVDISVGDGCLVGLIGPNGAGKTTLFNVICGLQKPASGRVVLRGQDVSTFRPHRRARAGLGRTFQKLEAFGSLTAYENVLVAAEIHSRRARNRRSPAEVADELLGMAGLEAVAAEKVGHLPTGTARLVELARALAIEPSVLLLDEPSSGLDTCESNELARILRTICARGISILLVEHDVDLVMSICDTIYVLDFGEVIAHGAPGEVRTDERVRMAYLGSDDSNDLDVDCEVVDHVAIGAPGRR